MKKKIKKIIIFGGTGFIGEYLARESLRKNFVVSIVSRTKPKLKIKKINYILLDVRQNKSFKKKLKNKFFDYVINLSGNINHSNNRETFSTHFTGCKNIANYFIKKKIKKFIQIGSCLEYGKIKSPHTEKLSPDYKKLKSSYSIAKLKATNYLLKLFNRHQFPVTVLRLYQIYGPGQKLDRLIPFVINSCLQKKNFFCSDGVQKKDFLYIDDLIKVIFKAMFSNEASGKIINIGQGQPTSIKKIILLINKKIRYGNPIYGKIKLRKDEAKILYPNISFAKKILRFSPKISLPNGLDRTIAFYSSMLKLRKNT